MGHDKVGVGVPSSYRKDANDKVDVLWKVKIKGRKFLADNIPLHMSLRVFDYLKHEDMERVKSKVRELDIRTPDPKNLKFKTIIFHSKHTGKDYFMLKVYGMHESCGKFFNCFKEGYGFSHKEFMSHITIDKHLYDAINKEGLKPEEIEFSALTVEKGANNTVHEFRKNEELLEKGLKHVVMAGGIAASSLLGGHAKANPADVHNYVNKDLHQMVSKYGGSAKSNLASNKLGGNLKVQFGKFSVEGTYYNLGAAQGHHIKVLGPKEGPKNPQEVRDLEMARKIHGHLVDTAIPKLLGKSEELEKGANNTVHEFRKSEELSKGQRGDWAKEGYRVEHSFSDTKSPNPERHSHVFRAFDRNNNMVGSATVHSHPHDHTKLMSAYTNVDEAHQRKGLASAMYELAERKLGRKFGPAIHQEDPGKKLWATPNRQFGKAEELEKGIKQVGAALGIASALAASPANQNVNASINDSLPQQSIQQPKQTPYSSNRMLRTIASVESASGKLQNHKAIEHGLSAGQHAFGRYGLTPTVVSETIHMNPDLKAKHKKAMMLPPEELNRYMQDNPGLEDAVAAKHLARLEHHFGQDPAKIGYAWLNGVSGTYKAMKEKKDIENHWHVTKIRAAYGKEK